MEQILWSEDEKPAPPQSHGIVYGQDILVAAWCWKEFNLVPQYINRAFGIVRENKLVGAAVFTNWTGFDANFSVWTHVGLTRDEFAFLARVATEELKIERITIHVPKNNKRASKRLLRLGAVAEGVLQCYYGREKTQKNAAIQYVFFREQLLKFGKRDYLRQRMH